MARSPYGPMSKEVLRGQLSGQFNKPLKSTKSTTKASPQGKGAPSLQSQIDKIFSGQASLITKDTSRDVGDISAYNLARAALLGQMAPQVQAGYGEAADSIAGYGAQATEGLQERLSAEAAAAQARFGGPGGYGGVLGGDFGVDQRAAYNPEGTARAAYSLGAYLPARTLQEQGAAFGAAAAAQPGAATTEGLYALLARQRTGAEDIAKLAGVQSGQRVEALTADAKLKAEARREAAKAKADALEAQREMFQWEREQARKALEFDTRESRYQSEGEFRQYAKQMDLKFQAAREARIIAKYEADGRRMDTSASRALGYAVDYNGSPMLGKNGKPVKVKDTSSDNQYSPGNNAYQKAVDEAASLHGEPMTTQNPITGELVFMAKPGAKGNDVKKIAGALITTNRSKARWSSAMEFIPAQDYLMSRYGLTRGRARQALLNAGWKADTRRPSGSGRITFGPGLTGPEGTLLP